MDELHRRGQALENLFFRAKDHELLDKMREELATTEGHAALSKSTGITDAGTLDALFQIGISSDSLNTVSLIPLVLIAWSDGQILEKEREAILKAADVGGIVAGSAGYRLLEEWMVDRPSDELFESWKSYIGAIKSNLDETIFTQLQVSIMGHARSIAESAGGFLGLGKISTNEEKTIADLNSAF